MTEDEEWRVSPHHDGYEVSSHGRVRNRGTGRVLKPTVVRGKNGKGVPYYRLAVPYGDSRYVHRLVAEAFLGAPPAGHVARHLDGNGLNNHVSNLAWGTHKDNYDDAVRHGTRGPATMCRKGLHEMNEENTYVNPTDGGRSCRPCKRAWTREQKRNG